MKEHESENLKKIRKFLIGPDYLVYRLTGVSVTDFCEASTSCLYRIGEKEWSEEMRNLIGLPWEVYPEIRGSAQSAGRLLPELCERFGLSDEVEAVSYTHLDVYKRQNPP